MKKIKKEEEIDKKKVKNQKKVKKEESKINVTAKKKSKLKIISIVVGIVFLLLILTIYFLLIGPSEKVKFALIQEIQGNVEIQINNQNNWFLAKEEQKLEKNDIIRTNEGIATLNFNNGILINLEPNTEVLLKDIIDNNQILLKQNSGTTWTKFINVLGVDSYEIETPNSVAVVRGTEFRLELDNLSTILLTTDGKVSFKDLNQNQEISVLKFEKALNQNQGLQKLELSLEDKKEILKNKEKILNQIKNLRQEEIYKNEFILNQVKKQYELDDEKIKELLNEIDKGNIDPSNYIEKVPFKIRNLDKILKYNDEIKFLIKDIEILKQELEN